MRFGTSTQRTEGWQKDTEAALAGGLALSLLAGEWTSSFHWQYLAARGES